MKKNEIILRDHSYDGIEEYDQKLPNWWLFTLYIMIVWFVIFWVMYYQSPANMQNDYERLDSKIAEINSKKQKELESMLATLNDESLMKMSKDSSHTSAGKAMFDTRCALCHGSDLSAVANGAKLPGVPLNDAEWKYGGKPLEIMKTITDGPPLTKPDGTPNPQLGMIAWNSQLSPAQITQIVAYILSKQPTQ